MLLAAMPASRPSTATGFLEGVAWPVREGLSNNRLQQTARWQFAAPLLNRVFDERLLNDPCTSRSSASSATSERSPLEGGFAS
jgi:hypothetical protein